ncbi:MAG: hypothetical protein UT93_C0025G0010 [Candidatus Woesebacteria bacterium GW2011_GWF1_40_24]|uniref:Major facilitator superfamily (MFS) profile domain-containing protein n=1 Tax=Candidatus Woesebacteria bacterium GW2011_GWF1_40_24 TaxID=1618601 RepID=A0A0G0RRC9_9BACT|nr:MAG: hypothetical protein UT93_C0025G0010 [Candidatus Woesebacteria bacterium GW2011_GWF1_40_24]
MFKTDPVWTKLLTFSLILFFIRLSDSIIAFWAPNQIQNSLNNPIIMGAIISFQSLVGFASDLVFPKIFKTVHTRRLFFWAILLSALTSVALASSTLMRAAAWGFTGIFVNLAYFLGPFIATKLLSSGILITQGTIIIFLVAALIILSVGKKKNETSETVDFGSANPLLELKHWATLSKAVWPALTIGLLLGFIDATFYTVGAVWTEKLSLVNPWGVWFLPLYLLPSICLGIPLSNWRIENGKKKLAEKFLGVAGVFFILIGINSSIQWQLAMVALAASAVAVCYPLLEGVYTDILTRMGSEKKDMIGLTGSALNISYIIWPVFAGLISARVGERMTFSWLGVMILVSSLILLLVTPRKIKLPQTEIKTWE